MANHEQQGASMSALIDILNAAPQIGLSLGAGSSPFVLAILGGRLRTRSQVAEQISEIRANAAARENEIKTNATEREDLLKAKSDQDREARQVSEAAREVERDRADALSRKLAEVATGVSAAMVHALEELPRPGGTPSV